MGKKKTKLYQKHVKESVSDDIRIDEEDKDDLDVNTEDDESIADSGSEVGWNSEDETTFGMNNDLMNGDEEDDYDDIDEEVQEGEVLLSDLLSGSAKPSIPLSKGDIDPSDYFENSEGEENSEEDIVTEDDSDNDSNSDDNDHEGLLAMIEKYSKGKNKHKATDHGAIVPQSVKESEFLSMMGAKGNNAVSMEDLLGALDNRGGDMTAVKNALSGLIETKNPPRHIEKVVANRVERDLSYKEKSEEMKKWQDTVIENRNARTLDLAQDRRQLPSYRSLIKNYEASNDMEKEVQMILLQGSDENAQAKAEDDELGNSNMSQEEIKVRQRELAKVRALLFYEQMKRHRVNKIKSKAYHRILKRKKKRDEEKMREALKHVDDSEDENEQLKNMTEEEAVRRIKERMNLRHHNTSKWSRMAVKHSHGNKSLRDAYHDSVLLGHELTKKANQSSKEIESGEEDSADDNSEYDKGPRTTTTRAAIEIANALQEANEEMNLDGKYSGLYKMEFMKKAKERQKDRAREEAADILRDLEQMERDAGSGNSSDDDNGRQAEVEGMRNEKDMEKLLAARQEMTEMMGNSKSLILSQSNRGNTVTVPDNVADDEKQNPWLVAPASQGRTLEVMAGKKAKILRSDTSHNVLLNMEHWNSDKLEGGESKDPYDDSEGKNSKNSKRKKTSNPTTIASSDNINDNEDQPKVKKPLLSQSKTQSELVSDAFAGPNFENDFAALKEKVVDEELNISGKKRDIESADKAGWGDWAGPGKIGVSEQVVRKRKRLLKNLEEKSAQQRAGRSDGKLANVILSERRVKTSSKYKIAEIPHPFTSREEYERSLQMPLGDEYNASHIVKKNAKPEILTRAGRIIDPITMPKDYKNKIAKNNALSTAKIRSLSRTAKFF